MALATNMAEPMQRSEQFLSSGGTVQRFKNPSIAEIDSIIEQIFSQHTSTDPILVSRLIYSKEVLNNIKNMPPEYSNIRVDIAYDVNSKPVSIQVSYEVTKLTESYYWIHTIIAFVENTGGTDLMRNLSVTYACWAGLDYRFVINSSPNDIFKNGFTNQFDVTNASNPSLDYEKMMIDMKTQDPTSSGAGWTTVPIALIQQASYEMLTQFVHNTPNLHKVVDNYPPVPDLNHIYRYNEDTKIWSPIS